MQARNQNDSQGLNEMSRKFIEDCLAEKARLTDEFPISAQLIDLAIIQVQSTGRIPGREQSADVFQQRPIKVIQQVYVPTKQFPRFNFTGKILGPKGNSLRRLQEETMCKIAIKGRNSMHDRALENSLRESGNLRHAHLHKNLYVEISAIAAPAEAYARVAYALAEIRKYLIPDKNDEVSQAQLHEIMSDPTMAEAAKKAAPKFFVFQKERMEPAYKTILQKMAKSTQHTQHYGTKQENEETEAAYEDGAEEYEEQEADSPLPYTRRLHTSGEKREPRQYRNYQSPTTSYVEPPKKRFRDAPSAPSSFTSKTIKRER